MGIQMTSPPHGIGRVVVVGAAISALLLCASMVAGQGESEPDAPNSDEEAKALFQAGRVAFEAGRYEDALDRWNTAYGLSGQPRLRYNIGLAAERLGRIDEAIAAFESYIKWEPDGVRSDEVRAKLTTLKATRGASTPAETANASQSTPESGAGPAGGSAHVDGDAGAKATPWYGQWWVWTAVGAVVAGVVIGVAVGSGGDEVVTQPESNVDVDVLTLAR